MNKIMELAEAYAKAERTYYIRERIAAREALDAEVQAHIDYTRAVIAERDALKAELEVAHIAIKQLVEVRDKTQQEANQLRKAAQMAEIALDKALHTNAPFGWDATKALVALRKGLGQ